MAVHQEAAERCPHVSASRHAHALDRPERVQHTGVMHVDAGCAEHASEAQDVVDESPRIFVCLTCGHAPA